MITPSVCAVAAMAVIPRKAQVIEITRRFKFLLPPSKFVTGDG
jgi:hypothetical protein